MRTNSSTRSTGLVPLLLLSGALLGLSVACDEGGAGIGSSIDTEINAHANAITHAVSRTGISTEIKLLRGQIALYKRLHEGKNPPSLEAMDTLPRLKFPDEYSYDPSTGVITSASYPSL